MTSQYQRHYLYFGAMLMTTGNPKLEDLRHALQTVQQFTSRRAQRKLTTDSVTNRGLLPAETRRGYGD